MRPLLFSLRKGFFSRKALPYEIFPTDSGVFKTCSPGFFSPTSTGHGSISPFGNTCPHPSPLCPQFYFFSSKKALSFPPSHFLIASASKAACLFLYDALTISILFSVRRPSFYCGFPGQAFFPPGSSVLRHPLPTSFHGSHTAP